MSDRAPRSPVEVLVRVESMLVDAHRGFVAALSELREVQPGMSGRPAGSGEPGGGAGGFTHSGPRASSSVVERAVEQAGPARTQLVRLELLPGVVRDDVVVAAASAGVRFTLPVLAGASSLEVSRLAVRALLDHGMARRVRFRPCRVLHDHTSELAEIVSRWGAAPAPARSPRPAGLVNDITELWCESCLRNGTREPRSNRYPTKGLCRWCGDFEAEQGFLPTLDLLDARRDGRRITEAMVRDARPRTVPAPRKRKR